MRWRRVEDVVLDWDVLIVELVNETKRWYVLGTRIKTSLAELLCNFLAKVSAFSQASCDLLSVPSVYGYLLAWRLVVESLLVRQ